MKPLTKRQHIYLYVIPPLFVAPAVLGVRHWQEDPNHDLGFLLARFLAVWLLAGGIGTAVTVLTVRLLDRK